MRCRRRAAGALRELLPWLRDPVWLGGLGMETWLRALRNRGRGRVNGLGSTE